MKKKILSIFIIIILTTINFSYAILVDVPVWSENGIVQNDIIPTNVIHNEESQNDGISNIRMQEVDMHDSETQEVDMHDSETQEVDMHDSEMQEVNEQNSGIQTVSAEPAEENFLNIQSESAILIEQTTGKVLYEKDCHKVLRPASVTKVMSILLVMEALDSGKISLTDTVPVSENASSMGGSQIWLDSRDLLTVDEMLKAMCVVSANDCTVAMAEFLAGSEEVFVGLMNDRAKQLGMNDTVFKNCHGIDEDGHVTSSYDISLMSRELLQNHPEITKYTTIWMDSLRDGKSQLVNTNKLVRNYDGCTGLKTGSTSLALYNLSASATRDDVSLIAVIMRAPTTKDRFNDAKKLLDYGFANYKFERTAEKGSIVKTIDIDKGTEKVLNLMYEKDSGILIEKTKSENIAQEIIINENISAPIKQGDILGKVQFYIADEMIDTVNLIAEKDIDKISIFSMYGYIINKWVNLLR